MGTHRSFAKLNIYLGREYILSFLVSFLFFFFIFFVNQILVIVQKIIIKNVSISDVLALVVLSIPQFLMFTMPFSSLSSACMVIGNFSSQNEIIALRASGIHTRRIFLPIVILSFLLSLSSLYISDYLIPYTALQYRQLYAKLLQSVPTLELKSNSSTQFGNRIISNGAVTDNVIHDVIIFDNENTKDSRVITADKAWISVVDLDNFIYRIDLENPQIFISDSGNLKTYSLASAKHMSLNIGLSSSETGYTNISPSQMSLTELRNRIQDKSSENNEMKMQQLSILGNDYITMGNHLLRIEDGTSNIDINRIIECSGSIKEHKKYKQFSFYYQYYKSEYQKKLALSFACTCLVFLAFPLSFFKIKYGRLVGFGLSMLCACFYWFFLYYMHLTSVTHAVEPSVLLWLPNVVTFTVGLILIKVLARN